MIRCLSLIRHFAFLLIPTFNFRMHSVPSHAIILALTFSLCSPSRLFSLVSESVIFRLPFSIQSGMRLKTWLSIRGTIATTQSKVSVEINRSPIHGDLNLSTKMSTTGFHMSMLFRAHYGDSNSLPGMTCFCLKFSMLKMFAGTYLSMIHYMIFSSLLQSKGI